MAPSNPNDILAIKNTLARYCTALDTKEFHLLHKVFAPDVVATYPFHADEFHGVEAISKAIQNRLGPIKTHHSLTTQEIYIESDTTALTVTHFIGVHFGQGPHAGKAITAYGTYVDELECLPKDPNGNDNDTPGQSGPWRIKVRTVEFTARIGDENIMKEF